MSKVIEIVRGLEKDKKYNGIITYKDGTKQKTRFMKVGDKQLFIFAKRSRKWGWYTYSYDNRIICNGREIVNIEVKQKREKTEKEKWERSINKAIKYLEESGLWADVLEELEIMREVGYEKCKKAIRIYWDYYNKDNIEKIKAIDKRLIKKYDNGNEGILSMLFITGGRPLKIKKMYFGKERNELILNRIKKAMEEKRPIQEWGTSSYDVSFEYNPKYNKAWYSEEYRGKGNGHYYIALNNAYALFMEDD